MRQRTIFGLIVLTGLILTGCQSNRPQARVRPVPLPSHQASGRVDGISNGRSVAPVNRVGSRGVSGEASGGASGGGYSVDSSYITLPSVAEPGAIGMMSEPIEQPISGQPVFMTPAIPSGATVNLPVLTEPSLAPPSPTYVVPPPSTTSEPAVKYHQVSKGDTLWRIAAKYYGDGRRWRDIADANGLVDPKQLIVGQKLTLP